MANAKRHLSSPLNRWQKFIAPFIKWIDHGDPVFRSMLCDIIPGAWGVFWYQRSRDIDRIDAKAKAKWIAAFGKSYYDYPKPKWYVPEEKE